MYTFLQFVRRLPAIAGLVAVVGFTLAGSLALPMAVQAEDAGGPTEDDPKCAVVGFGPVTECPPQAGLGSGECAVLNPTASDPAMRSWQPVGCDSQAFIDASVKPIAILCDGTAPPDAGPEYRAACDPALACAEDCNLVIAYINPAIRAASALVGIGVTTAIVWGGIKYSRSADDPQAVNEAKRIITTAILTLIGYFLFYQFLNWIIPGGLGAPAP